MSDADWNKKKIDNEGVASLKTGRFPKSARLLKSFQYQHLHRNSARLFGQTLIVQFQKGHCCSTRLGLTVSKKFGKAHERNRFKRIIREAFRELYTTLPPYFDINVSPQKKIPLLSKQILFLELKELLNKILQPR